MKNKLGTSKGKTLSPTILIGTTCLGKRFSFSEDLKARGQKIKGKRHVAPSQKAQKLLF
jgi:hypothetical protein